MELNEKQIIELINNKILNEHLKEDKVFWNPINNTITIDSKIQKRYFSFKFELTLREKHKLVKILKKQDI